MTDDEARKLQIFDKNKNFFIDFDGGAMSAG